MNSPIFLFSAGWRSGSTLLQRMLSSTGKVLMWGEAGGAMENFVDAMDRYAQMLGEGSKMFKHGPGGHGHDQYQEFARSAKDGVHKWIACLNPPLTVFEESLRVFFANVYARPAADLGYSNWGIKEVQSGLECASFLRNLYPEAKFLFLVRNPIDCLTSIKRRNWLGHHGDADPVDYYSRHWARLAKEFSLADFGIKVRYEDVVNSKRIIDEIGDYLGFQLPTDFAGKSRIDWHAENEHALGFIERLRINSLTKDARHIFEYK